MKRKILIMGLPGAGKTTLTNALAPLLDAVVVNGDAVRKTLSADLGWSYADRIEQARRISRLCDEIIEKGSDVIADFVCPTEAARQAFGKAFVIWMDRIKKGRFDDTNAMFEPPAHFDVRIEGNNTLQHCVEIIRVLA